MSAERAERAHRSSRSRLRSLLAAAASVAGVAIAVIGGRDGSPGWLVVRVVATIAVAGAAAFTIWRGTRRAAGLAAFAVGVIATAVGAGIGGPHVAKGGALLPTVAGLIALLAGVTLLAGGAAALVGTFKGWRKAPVLVAAVLVAIPVGASVAAATAATNVPRTSLGRETPADRGLPYREVLFPATDGVILSGWYVPSHNGAAIVLLHGAGSTRSGVLDQAAVLARHGFGVLLFDARGHGRSRGRAMDFGWNGDADVGGAVSFLDAQPGVEVIGAVGMSMGGEEAIGAAATDRRIRAVVAEGATNRVTGDRAWLRDDYGLRGWLQLPIDWLTFAVADELTSADPPITLRAAVTATASPVLLVSAGDVSDEGRAAQYIASASPATVEVWEVPGAGHTGGLRTDPAEWETRVTTFLSTALGIE